MVRNPATPPANIRILLVDDHSLVRAGLRMLIETYPNLRVVGEASNGTEALDLAGREQPDIILLDLDLGGDRGIDLIPQLYSAAGKARIILLTGVRDREQHQEAVHLGAMGVILKEQAASVLLQAIERVHAGEIWLDPSLVASVISRMTRPNHAAQDPELARIASLTDRECEVIALVSKGLPNKEIARRLHITETTVGH